MRDVPIIGTYGLKFKQQRHHQPMKSERDQELMKLGQVEC